MGDHKKGEESWMYHNFEPYRKAADMLKRRKEQIYELKKGGKVVDIGRSKHPEQRAQEHKRDGLRFDEMKVLPQKLTDKEAREEEKKLIDTYEDFNGNLPPHNKRRGG